MDISERAVKDFFTDNRLSYEQVQVGNLVQYKVRNNYSMNTLLLCIILPVYKIVDILYFTIQHAQLCIQFVIICMVSPTFNSSNYYAYTTFCSLVPPPSLFSQHAPLPPIPPPFVSTFHPLPYTLPKLHVLPKPLTYSLQPQSPPPLAPSQFFPLPLSSVQILERMLKCGRGTSMSVQGQ